MWSSNLDNSGTFEGGFLDSTNKTGPDDVKLRRVQTIVPVMIGHLLAANSVDETMIWDIPARMFSIVGIIRHMEETATKMSYDVEDQTGTITALKWLEAEKKASGLVMQMNVYVNIIGLLREQNEKRHILILRLQPLEDLNELTNHIFEVTYATLKAQAMSKKNKEGQNNESSVMENQESSEDSPYYGMTKDQTLVYKIIHAQNDTESGIERSDIKAKVPKKILPELDTILDFLVSEGHIYTTSTDNHFKTT
ncbi:replication protein A 32 kDa subunit [Hylaeus anthracinus]|uniref:replication protein A 32 kDa subunit n=1 Tax=Hylaeus anthracinus TaxID=313031 RepID=UPI0023B96FCA|nr:replication protein A 32 kDa subunit [Hylaeus anthracinus]